MIGIRALLSELRQYICNHIVTSVPSNQIRMLFYRRIMGFELHDGVCIHMGARFDCAKGLKIGSNSVINENCRLDSRAGISIGSNVAIAAESIILTADHDPNASDFSTRLRPVLIEDYVFVGTRSLILGGVTLHRGAVVAAGSVVSRDVKALDIVAGVPARPIGARDTEFSYDASYRRYLH